MSVWRVRRGGAHGNGRTTGPAGQGQPAGRAGAPAGRTGAAGAAAAEARTVAAEAAEAGAVAPEAVLTVDALGRKCPIPIIMLAERIRDVPVGSVIAVLADDPAAVTDIPAWCGMKSQQFVVEVPLERGWSFLVRRAY
jgi:tRNA 2-thiouridine synthesizing protein A